MIIVGKCIAQTNWHDIQEIVYPIIYIDRGLQSCNKTYIVCELPQPNQQRGFLFCRELCGVSQASWVIVVHDLNDLKLWLPIQISQHNIPLFSCFYVLLTNIAYFFLKNEPLCKNLHSILILLSRAIIKVCLIIRRLQDCSWEQQLLPVAKQ